MRLYVKRTLNAIIAVITAVFILATASSALAEYNITHANGGYGYGYGDCAEAPANLNVRYLKGVNKAKVALRWDAINDACEGIDYYQVQLRRNNNNLVDWWNISGATIKRVKLDTLNPNRLYKWRVRAVFEDGDTSDWSLYDTFRTKPRRPGAIRIDSLKSTTVRASWKNVARSRLLKQYKVVVQKVSNNKVVFKKKVKKRLRKKRNNVRVKGLSPDTKYRIKIKSVYSSSLKSTFRSKVFTTPSS